MKNYDLKDAKKGMIICCVFITTSDPFHFKPPTVNIKILIRVALNPYIHLISLLDQAFQTAMAGTNWSLRVK